MHNDEECISLENWPDSRIFLPMKFVMIIYQNSSIYSFKAFIELFSSKALSILFNYKTQIDLFIYYYWDGLKVQLQWSDWSDFFKISFWRSFLYKQRIITLF